MALDSLSEKIFQRAQRLGKIFLRFIKRKSEGNNPKSKTSRIDKEDDIIDIKKGQISNKNFSSIKKEIGIVFN